MGAVNSSSVDGPVVGPFVPTPPATPVLKFGSIHHERSDGSWRKATWSCPIPSGYAQSSCSARLRSESLSRQGLDGESQMQQGCPRNHTAHTFHLCRRWRVP
jgi:hypothetical protein